MSHLNMCLDLGVKGLELFVGDFACDKIMHFSMFRMNYCAFTVMLQWSM